MWALNGKSPQKEQTAETNLQRLLVLEQSEMTYKSIDFNMFGCSSKKIGNINKEQVDVKKIQIDYLEMKTILLTLKLYGLNK